MSSGLEDTPTHVSRASTWPRATTKVAARITGWRDWKLPVKIGAVVLVPVIFALVLGVLQIRGQISQADEYSAMDRIVTAGTAVRTAVQDLQWERTESTDFLVRGQTSEPQVRDRIAATDRTLEAARGALRAAPDNDAVRFARQETNRQIAELAPTRNRVLSGKLDPDDAIQAYTEVIGDLLALDRTLLSQISSAQLVSPATSAHELAKIREEVQLQQALLLTGLTRGKFTEDNLTQLDASESRRSAAAKEFRAAASLPNRISYDQLYADPRFPARETSVQLAMAERNNSRAQLSSALVSPAIWHEQSLNALAALGALGGQLDQQLHETAFNLQDRASNLAGFESVILLSALLIAGAIVVAVARHLLGSLDLLRRSALDTANHQLPSAVADIRAGHAPRSPVEQVPVNTADEVGDLARAFDDVHTQAVNLATEQAELRRSYSDSFVNVSRRSQSLLERQLRLFEQLERDEEDPDQLATLFQLDHLATRMRRNNENLMVLSGTDLARRFTQPTSPADLVRAAISEIEHYPRVIVQPLPDVKIVGYAASDLVRLLAELMDNAANFSAPHTQVTVSGHRRGDGALVVDIVDQGIGMSETDRAETNVRLASDGELTLSTSRRMGLFVVGRLAARHGIHVELHPGAEGRGLRASVAIGPELLADAVNLPQPRTNGAAPHHERTSDALVEEFDWEAAEQDAASPIRNGYHLLRPPRDAESVPEQRDVANAQEESPSDGATNGAPTPIFDNLASAWFQAAPPTDHTTPHWPPPGDASKGTFLSSGATGKFPSSQPTHNGSNGRVWAFASDEARQRAQEVAAAEPTNHTSAGLPQRIPLANLVAGSAEAPGAEQPRPQRNPDVARGRLTSFQAGLRRGRHRQRAEPENSAPAIEQSAAVESDAEPPAPTRDQEVPDHTSAGLPRRIPKTQLLPGTVTEVAQPRRDADMMRGRLASFQRGVREGKHSLRDPQRSADERL
ncbi:Signal transduction histidine kinase [Saccharopolyspora antimicrobica]|uniref:histidine kinase n=1 Tax=Saccharopolyspora antimicrobica TaxID=455193 RepID=A0A1I5KKK6_9PSEU|nr:nitrate- and nitrite sensing domain-containing protein [Saccharopolyspora antimicrobica]RKT85645.1 signal transduction histidine kinase [Saccharopolyspora antimicrobica]SFO85343.1 Signal transduction histidine kinase [Saccharopolyspora antimicrobica]